MYAFVIVRHEDTSLWFQYCYKIIDIKINRAL